MRSGVSGDDDDAPLTSERTEAKIKKIETFIGEQGKATGGYVKNLNQLLKRRDKLGDVKVKLDKTNNKDAETKKLECPESIIKRTKKVE